MTQHTQPVVAAQHQQHQQQQQQTTTISNNNNNNISNNNSATASTNSNPTTNNNQTQTVSIQQQHPSNNNNANNNNSYQSHQQIAAGGQIFSPQLQSGNVYVPTHGMTAHHQQHHQPGGAMYPTMTPAALPSNVFVNNLTANVNLHGWPHTVPHGAWVHPNPNYIHGDLPPEQSAPVIQPMGAMPVTLPAPNALTGAIINPNGTVISSGTRGTRRSRGRSGTSSSRRGDYNIQRHPQPEGSPAPQQSVQANQQEMQQQQQGQQQTDAQQIMTPIPASYVSHPQYATHPSQYPYGYQTFFTPQQHMIHPGQNAAAQQATGTPLYFSAMPVYNGPHMYNYGYYLPPVINQSDYQYGEEVGVGDERQTSAEGGAMVWHQQPIYSEEYSMNPVDMHGVASDDMNASSIGSSNETPTMLSPNYPPLYEQMTQQLGVMQIYDDPQMGQMQMMHQAGVPQMEEELSECGSQPSASIQMVPPMQMIPAAVAPPMALQAATSDQILHQQQTPHLIAVIGGAIMPIDGPITPNATPHHHMQHAENAIDCNLQTYDNIAHLQSSESVTSLNEDFLPQASDNLETEYQLQQQEIPNQNIMLEIVQPNNYNGKNIIMTEAPELQEASIHPTKSVTVVATTNDVCIETNIQSNRQQQPIYQQQQSLEKPSSKQRQQQPQQQQILSKQNVSQQQQQYQHQQLQTQPMPETQQQQQTVPITQQQQQQQSQYETATQHQHHQQQHQTHQQTYENRKSSQMYNQQHQSRSRKYEYHHGHSSSSSNNDNSSHQPQQQTHQQQPQQQQQQQSQQTNKTMSWTNSSQHKKSTNTVSVTATPTTSHTSGSYNKQANNPNSSSSHTHGTRTYTNQQHHNYQHQQNYHYQQQQQQQHQPQTRNYGAMKLPSSPISSASSTMERKNSQTSDKGQIIQQQLIQTQTTSTASTTAAPHQFQQQQSQQTSTHDIVHTKSTSTGSNTAAASTSTPAQHTTVPSKQQSQHYPSGFSNKKHSFSNYGHGSSNTTTNTASACAVETTQLAPAINLAPPVTNITPTAPSTPSWASLFSNNSSTTSSSSISNTAPVANNLSNTSSSSSITVTAAYSKKPVAKVAPYEGLTPVSPPPPVLTPGTLSYSAASAQNLPPPSSNASATTSAAKKSFSSEQQSQRNSLANLDEYSLKFAEFLTKYKSDWTTISLRPRGLTNRSNYCYINSILQALLGCSPLYNLIRSIPKQAANLCEVKTPTINAMMAFMSNFSNLPSGLRLRNTKGGKGNKDDLGGDLQCDLAFEPTDIYKLWNDSREEHVEGRQEDAEEFLSYILNKLNDEMLEVIKLIAKPNTVHNGQNEPVEEDGDVWQMICNNRNKGSVTRQTDFGCTPLSDIFRGELRSRLQREGEHSTDVIQPFFTLQLNIEKAASVKEALEILVGRDQLEGVTGSKTKQEVVAWQQMNLEKLPPILILHLKWFDYRSDGCTKILKKVDFPVELKIDAKILASKKYSQKQRAYRLFAVVYHDGKEATKGHYITDVYHSGYGSWLRYDDSSVKPVSENHVLLPRTPRVPYLLCYRRCDTIPQQSNNNNNQNNSSTAGSNNNNNASANTQSSLAKEK